MQTTEWYEASEILDTLNYAVRQNALLQKAKGSQDDKFLYDILIHVAFFLREECSSAEQILPRNRILEPTFTIAESEWTKIYNRFCQETNSDVILRQKVAHFQVSLTHHLARRFFVEADNEMAENPQEICRRPMADVGETRA